MTTTLSKRDLTKLFLEQAKIDTSDSSIKAYMFQLWATPYSPIGYRLSLEGNRFLHDVLDLERHTCKIKEDTIKSSKLFLQLNKYIQCPYYLQGNNSIVLYGEVDAMMLVLMDGNLQQYLDNFTRA